MVQCTYRWLSGDSNPGPHESESDALTTVVTEPAYYHWYLR